MNEKEYQYLWLMTPLDMTRTSRGLLTKEQVNALLNAADPRWRGLIVAALHAGQRPSRMAKLTWAARKKKIAGDPFSGNSKPQKLVVLLPLALAAYFRTLPTRKGNLIAANPLPSVSDVQNHKPAPDSID